MSFAAPDIGEVLLLKYMINHTAPDNLRVHLYKNDITPSEDDVLSQYTECTASGYTSKSLSGSAWTVTTTLGTTTATYPTQTFTFTTSDVVRGYYMTNNASSQLLWAEKFDNGPYNLPSGGGTVELDPAVILE